MDKSNVPIIKNKHLFIFPFDDIAVIEFTRAKLDMHLQFFFEIKINHLLRIHNHVVFQFSILYKTFDVTLELNERNYRRKIIKEIHLEKSMVKKMAKMSRSNVKARRWMEANGFTDIHFFPHTRWSKDLHFQDLEFDGLACSGATLVLFQVKSNCKATKKVLKQYDEVFKKFYVRCLWINAPDRKPLEVNNVPQVETCSPKQ